MMKLVEILMASAKRFRKTLENSGICEKYSIYSIQHSFASLGGPRQGGDLAGALRGRAQGGYRGRRRELQVAAM